METVAREIESFNHARRSLIDTIYFGGGTPSLLTPAQVELLLATVKRRFDPTDDVEVTMEMNPGTVTLETLRQFRQLGVNRASFGAQTFDDRELARLGRSHSANDSRQTFKLLRAAGFENVSFDLIAGLPGQSLEKWQSNIDEALSLRPEHLSFYLLEVHQGTPLADHIRKGMQPQPDDELAAEMYEVMLEKAVAGGYRHYEISNLALPGYESRHNTKYWAGDAYFGFACSAHSYDGENARWSNERDVDRYMKLIDQNGSAVVSTTALSTKDRRAEAAFLGLRLMSGINLSHYRELFGEDLKSVHADDLERFSEAGLIEFDGELVRLTRAGALMSNEVFAAFI